MAVSCIILEPSPMFSSTVRSRVSVGNTGGLSLISWSVISTYKEKRNKKYPWGLYPKCRLGVHATILPKRNQKHPKSKTPWKEGYKIFIGTNKDNQTASNLLMVNDFKWSQWNSDWKMYPEHCHRHPPKGLPKLGTIYIATMMPVDTSKVVKPVFARNDCTVATEVCGKEGYSPIV